jgi:hypothetical protein
MDSFEECGRAMGFEVGEEAFWSESFDILRARMADYARLAAPHLGTS